MTVARIGFFSLFGIYAFSTLLQRYSEGPLKWWMYPVFLLGGAAAFYPLHWGFNVMGAAIVSGLIFFTAQAGKRLEAVGQS